MMLDKSTKPAQLDDEALDDVQGGRVLMRLKNAGVLKDTVATKDTQDDTMNGS